MTIVLDNLPANVDLALHQKATTEGRSIRDVAAEAVARGLGVTEANAEDRTLMSKKAALRQLCESIRRSIPPGVSLSEELMAERKVEAASE